MNFSQGLLFSFSLSLSTANSNRICFYSGIIYCANETSDERREQRTGQMKINLKAFTVNKITRTAAARKRAEKDQKQTSTSFESVFHLPRAFCFRETICVAEVFYFLFSNICAKSIYNVKCYFVAIII